MLSRSLIKTITTTSYSCLGVVFGYKKEISTEDLHMEATILAPNQKSFVVLENYQQLG